MEFLDEKLYQYGHSDFYPFHMPGHKRQTDRGFLEDVYKIDITEITDFDNLHHPEGILKESQEYAAGLYGTKKTYFLVNGSTAGILAAVSACTGRRGKLLMARNCHKAAYHGAYLRELQTVYLYPSYEKDYGLNGGISCGEVEEMLERHPDIQAVLLTSPSYDGVVSEIERIAEIVHKRNLPLIVDEAHGAHLPFGEYFPKSAISCGADLVIQSLHKTLPSLTQTAVLHVCSDRVELPVLERFLDIYQTSSPSYVFLASIMACLRFLEQKGQEVFSKYSRQLGLCRERLRAMKSLRLIGEEMIGKGNIYDFDRSKLIISGKEAGLSGPELHRILREQWHLELEMESENYVLALTSVSDTQWGFSRITKALLEIDRQQRDLGKYIKSPEDFIDSSEISKAEQVYPISRAMEADIKRAELKKSEGKISAEYAYLYPPGIPILVPGERIARELLDRIQIWEEKGLCLQGLTDYTQKTILIMKEE